MKILMVLTSHDKLGDTGKKTGFWLEDVLKQQGGDFSEGGVFGPHVVRDGLLITGQNPPSSEPTAKKLLELRAAAG
nr:hypothetical protein [Qipengyuania proteolytica]